LQQLEPVSRDNQVQVTRFSANRTIAAVDIDPVRNFRRKPDAPTMASA